MPMADFADPRIWLKRGVFVLVSAVILMLHMVPLDLRPAQWAAPDLMLAMVCVWVARRPDYVPVLLIAAVFFLADLLLQRPPGLWTALVILLTEAIRNRHRELRSMPFLAEWGFVTLGLIVITLANRFVLAIVLTPQAPLGLTLMQLGGTILIYPVVVFAGYLLLGVAHPAPGDLRNTRQLS
jgi:rod shape-determining protein MreD